MMLEWALKANLPVIGVRTDDTLNFPIALQILAGAEKPIPQWTKDTRVRLGKEELMWTFESSWITGEVVQKLQEAGQQVVVVNPESGNLYIFNGGIMPTPPEMIRQYLTNIVQYDEQIPTFMTCLKGLSLKAAAEAVLITEARTGALTVPELRKTRSMLSGSTQGLTLVDTSYDFYDMPDELSEWLKINTPYFLQPTHEKLVPRGLLMAGLPGVGKSMSSKAIANHFDVPLYRLDVATVLTKFIGDSEQRMSSILSLLDREEPAVALLDEIEKLFNTEGQDTGVTKRLLSQLLWWLQEHRSKVFVVMTTNHMDSIPTELYRPGRVDQVMTVHPMNGAEARHFAHRVFRSVVAKDPTKEQMAVINKKLTRVALPPPKEGEAHPSERFAHARVTQAVYELIKEKTWLNP